ncbi:hypothetical protein [Rhizobium tibeticum]|uniref:hypothetical protein n=1 Tax=Rhizobium tibeticum TaxID=501024 RepID=UPI000AAD2E58|nr:hypothetical protein [Rhizobium tibeticum]
MTDDGGKIDEIVQILENTLCVQHRGTPFSKLDRPAIIIAYRYQGVMPTAWNAISFQIWNTAFQSVPFNLAFGGTTCGAISFGAVALWRYARSYEPREQHDEGDAPHTCDAAESRA